MQPHKEEFRFRDLPKAERERLIQQVATAIVMQQSAIPTGKKTVPMQIPKPIHDRR